MSTVATLAQVHFRVRTDTATVETAPTWAAAEDTNVSLPVETTFRIRFCIQNTGTAASTGPAIIRVSKNGGAYTAVTTSTGATLGAQSADASSDADGASVTTPRLTAGAGTASFPGGYDETGSTGAAVTNGTYSEFEFGLILKTAGAAAGNTFDFRIYNSTTAFTTYTQTPRITCIAEASGSDFQPKTAAVIAYGHYDAAGHTTSSATVSAAQNAGDLVVVFYAVDNVATTDVDEAACGSITDSAGNIYTKVIEYSKSGGALQGGVVSGIWYCQLAYALSTSNTITATWSQTGSRDAVAMGAKSFTLAANKVVTVEATATGVSTAAVAVPSLNPTTANIECLRFRVNGAETNASQDFAIARHTFGWAGFGDNAANSGSAATSIVVGAESRISTGTSDASSPRDQAVAVDQAGVYVAFRARALATGTDFNEKNTAASVYSDYNSVGHATSAIGVTGAAAIGDLVVLAYATDNTTTASGGDAEIHVSSITDSRSNTYSKAYTAQYGGASTQTGSGVGIYYSQITTALVLGDTITVTWNNSGDRDAIAACAKVFTIGGGKTVAVEAVNQDNGAGVSTPPSLDATTANIECLRVRATGLETRAVQLLSSTGWTGLPPTFATTSTSVSASSQSLAVEFKISTGTSDASTPVAGATVDQASVYVAFKAIAAVDTEDDLLANNVSSGSNVTQPALQQVHNISANDIVSPSSVSQPVAVVRRDILANDVTSGSSVSVPTAASIVPPVACLANDVKSNSSVSQPSVQQHQALLANDVKSNSSVSQPAAVIRRDALANDVLSASSVTKPTQFRQSHTFLANDVLSGSSVTHPAAIVGKTVLANDVVSTSSVGQPAVHAVHALAANDVLSASSVGVPAMLLPGQIEADDVVAASSVTTPTLHQAQSLDAVNVVSASSVTTPVTVIRRDILANDIVSASSVSQPAVHLNYGLLANDIVSGSSVSHPALAEIAPGVDALLANDVVSASFVSTPTLVVEGEVIPVPPEVGGGGKVYGRGFPRKRWEELLRRLEEERQEALERANAFKGTKDRKQAKKAARSASEAIAAAREAADEAAVLAHAGEITRMLEGAAQATSLTEYLERMKAAKAEAEAMEDEDDVETVLMMVA